jgi:hypothetical protein
VHFMVWVRGRPVDPYLAAGEDARAGTWLSANDPRPSGPVSDDREPGDLADVRANEAAVDAILARCHDPAIHDELTRATSLATRLALLEDSIHHDRHAWPSGTDVDACRPAADARAVRLTLPLPASIYRGARPVDSPWTAPPT